MPAFPVTSSILAPAAIAAFVAGAYGLQPGATARLLKTGINHTYRIDSGPAVCVFRVYSLGWRTRAEIGEELELLEYLKESGIAVSGPLRDTCGNFIQTIPAPEGERLAVLFSYAPGRKLPSYGADTHYAVGSLMARMHRLTQGRRLERTSYTPSVLLEEPLTYISRFLAEESEEMAFLRSTKPLLERELKGADTGSLREGVVHLDIWFDNLNVSDDGGITLFDFDFCGNGWLCLDIAYYMLQLHNIEKDEQERRAKAEAFYAGYESVETIDAEEKRLVPTLVVCLYYFYLGVQCRRFDNWSNTFLNEAYLSRYVSSLIRGAWERSR